MNKHTFTVETGDSGRAPFRYKKIAAGYTCDAILLRLGDCNVLWDCDFACTAPLLIGRLKEELAGEELNYLLLSHSHYDHCAGAPYIKEAFPEVQIVAASHAAEVFQKESAREKMLELDDALAERRGLSPAGRGLFSSIRADIAVNEGDSLLLGSHRAIVLEAFGHTRDSICFWFPKEKLLLGTETLGVYTDGSFGLAMLTGYESTVSSLKKVRDLPVETYMLPHGAGVVFGNAECRACFDQAMSDAEATKNQILTVFSKDNWSEESIEAAIQMIIETGNYYDPTMIRARELNASIMVKQIYLEFRDQS